MIEKLVRQDDFSWRPLEMFLVTTIVSSLFERYFEICSRCLLNHYLHLSKYDMVNGKLSTN